MSTSDSSLVSYKRRSQRLVEKSFKSVEGPTHVDLTGEADSEKRTKNRHEPTVSRTESSSGGIPKVPSESKRYPKFSLPVGLSVYNEMKESGDLDSVSVFVKDQGFESEVEYVRKLEENGLVKSGMAESLSKSVQPSEESLSKEDENEILIKSFKPKTGVAALFQGDANMLFRSRLHEEAYSNLLNRGIINPRTVDFDILDAIGIDLRSKFAKLQLEEFCAANNQGFAELTAYFYSNLSFVAPDHIQFSNCDSTYDITADTLADIIKVERGKFTPIRATERRIVKSLSSDGKGEGWITYDRMSSKDVVLHKIVSNCIRPKASSKTDVSKQEARLMFAIKKGKNFSLSHIILLHMYGVISKEKGQLPYAGLIYKIFRHFRVAIHINMCHTIVDIMAISDNALSKMRREDVSYALQQLKRKRSETPEKAKKKKVSPSKPAKKKKIVLKEKQEDIPVVIAGTDDIPSGIPILSTAEEQVLTVSNIEEKKEGEGDHPEEGDGMETGGVQKEFAKLTSSEVAAIIGDTNPASESRTHSDPINEKETEVQTEVDKQAEDTAQGSKSDNIADQIVSMTLKSLEEAGLGGEVEFGEDSDNDVEFGPEVEREEAEAEAEILKGYDVGTDFEIPSDFNIHGEQIAVSASLTVPSEPQFSRPMHSGGTSDDSTVKMLKEIIATQADVIITMLKDISDRQQKVEEVQQQQGSQQINILSVLKRAEDEQNRQNKMLEQLKSAIGESSSTVQNLAADVQTSHDNIHTELAKIVQKTEETSKDLGSLRIVKG